ncbi:MAG: methionine--tRNA ligase [Bacteriovoracaceae bacterium]|nr:methionine--tRNA ligase [Bacteriovoracaceae bacterium]
MGHAYEKVVADLYARWNRQLGTDVFFLTGTDENGQKLVKAAEAEKIPTKEYVDAQVKAFEKLCIDLKISKNDFIRTTEARHHKTCQEFWTKLEAKGDIYFGAYEGQYCLACESFYTELQAPDGLCPVHGTKLDAVKEKGYFFRLSSYADWVRSFISDNPNFISPASARKEMLNRIDKEPIRDLSVSRPNAGWGIPIPGHEDFVMYTWFDALINYLSAVATPDLFKKYWPADMHVIGKDITWFHAVIWPAMLKAADYELPKQIYVHGMVLGEDGKKMSKSLGNGVDPQTIISKFPIDSFRYYLLRAIPSGLDGAFVTADLRMRHNSELANDYGNLLMRVVKLGMKKCGSDFSPEGVTGHFNFETLGAKMAESMNEREHHRALELLWASINEVNLYLNDKAPWKLEGADPKFKETIYNALYAIHSFGTLISPFMPEVGEKTLFSLGTENKGMRGLKFGIHQFKLVEPPVLFPKMDA